MKAPLRHELVHQRDELVIMMALYQMNRQWPFMHSKQNAGNQTLTSRSVVGASTTIIQFTFIYLQNHLAFNLFMQLNTDTL